jgi:DNA ligase 1
MITLYKKDSKGKCRIINFWCERNLFHTEAGIISGKLVKNTTNCVSKNIGKSNETSAENQAILEMESKIREKLQEDYFHTEEEAMNSVVILPMLAKKFEEEEHKIDWNNCFIQPKLDGQRCLAVCTKEGVVTLLSRDGIDIQKTHGSMQHIIDDLSTIKEDVVLDGELYTHSVEDNFQDIMKAIKKYRPGVSELVKYHVYDIVSDKPFRLRKIRHYIKGLFSCQEVSTYNIKNKQDLEMQHETNLGSGYEGSIIRWGNEGYKMNGRSSNLLKYKNFKDNDFLIIDVFPAENRPEWGMIKCTSNNGEFDATAKMSHKEKKDLLINKNDYIGQTAIIRHFGFTDKGLPRFPIYHGIRNDNLK